VDFDRKEVLERAADYMPYTPMMDGRPGKPNSHWYYRVVNIPPEFIATPNVAGGAGGPRTKRFGPAKIDWQGTGVQVVCPPSVHASGETRVWADPDAEPPVIDFMDLWESTRELALEFGWVDRTIEGRQYVMKRRAVAKQGGHDATFHVASALVNGYQIDGEDAWDILQSWNRTNAEPPWSEGELRYKLESAIAAIGTDPRFPPGYLIRDGRNHTDPDLLASRLPGVWRCWNGNMFRNEEGRYRMLSEGDLNADLRRHVDVEFGKLHQRALYAWEKDGREGKAPRRMEVKRGTVGEVLAALQARAKVPDDLEMPCLLPDGDQRQWIAVTNGILDLETGELRSHTPDWFSTVRLGFAYDPAAQEPRLAGWLTDWFGGDSERAALAQEWVGYCLLSPAKPMALFS
jgi:hypothetical protein